MGVKLEEDALEKAHQQSLAAQKLLNVGPKLSHRSDINKSGDVIAVSQNIEKTKTGSMAKTIIMKKSSSKTSLGSIKTKIQTNNAQIMAASL